VEHIPLPIGPAEREASKLWERTKLKESAPTSSVYTETHDEISKEKLDDFRAYLGFEGFEENKNLGESALEFIARNYELEDFKKVGISKIIYDNVIMYVYTPGIENEKKLYNREEYEKAKANNELPEGDEWLRVRAHAISDRESEHFGDIKLFDTYDYPYEMPDVVKEADNKEEALLEYLLAHEIGHFYFKNLYATENGTGAQLERGILANTEFGQFFFIKDDEGNMYYNPPGMGYLIDNPFTPYLKTRVKAIKPLYDECIIKGEFTDDFILEYAEYFEEFFAESAALTKNMLPNKMNEIEKYFVYLYDNMENIIHAKGEEHVQK